MTVCFLGLGGNVSDVVTAMDAALDCLNAHERITVTRVSGVFETAPMGADAGGRFLNAAAELETDLDPNQFLDVLKTTEQELGRAQSDRWSERVIDLDLLLFGSAVVKRPELVVPHPHLWYRRFVLDPLVEIAADVTHPLFDESLAELRMQLGVRPLAVTLLGGEAESRREAAGALASYAPLVNLHSVRAPKSYTQNGPSTAEHGIRLAFLDSSQTGGACQRIVDLSTIPGTVGEALASVMTAALDEPQVHKRPLRRMP